ncbi:MAG: hypothetical protein ACK55Z_29325, partial [bacterium]
SVMCALFSSALPHPFSAPLHPACLKHHPTSLPALSSVAASTATAPSRNAGNRWWATAVY